MTLTFDNGIVSSDQRTVTVAQLGPCPTTTIARTTTSTATATTTTTVGTATTLTEATTTTSSPVSISTVSATTLPLLTGTVETIAKLPATGLEGADWMSLVASGLVALGVLLCLAVVFGPRRQPR